MIKSIFILTILLVIKAQQDEMMLPTKENNKIINRTIQFEKVYETVIKSKPFTFKINPDQKINFTFDLTFKLPFTTKKILGGSVEIDGCGTIHPNEKVVEESRKLIISRGSMDLSVGNHSLTVEVYICDVENQPSNQESAMPPQNEFEADAIISLEFLDLH